MKMRKKQGFFRLQRIKNFRKFTIFDAYKTEGFVAIKTKGFYIPKREAFEGF